MAVHVHRDYVFFSDNSGAVRKLPFNQPEKAEVIYESKRNPTSMAVDWLHDKLYIVEDTQVKKLAMTSNKTNNDNVNSMQTCNSVTFYFMKNSFCDISRKWILPKNY